MEITIVQDKDNEYSLHVAVDVEDNRELTFTQVLAPVRLELEKWGQANGYGSIIPYVESLAGGNEHITVFVVSFVSFTKPEKS